jgi:hypothetical protein
VSLRSGNHEVSNFRPPDINAMDLDSASRPPRYTFAPTSSEPQADQQSRAASSKPLSGGAIAGIVVGCVLGVAVVAAVLAVAVNAFLSPPPSAPTHFSDEEVYYQLV